MNLFKQIGSVTRMNIEGIPQRAGPSSVIVVGVAAVVGVLITALAIADGLAQTLVRTGRQDRVLVLRSGATYETASSLSKSAVQTIGDAPGVARTSDGKPAITADVVVTVSLSNRHGVQQGINVRGVTAGNAAVRPEIKLRSGRMFRPGLREVIVGRGAQQQFGGLDIGASVPLREGGWTVVGTFDSGGDVHDSELLTDADTLASASGEVFYNSVTALLDSPSDFDRFKATLAADPTLSVAALREPAYYERQTESAGKMMYIVSHAVALIMAIGAVFGALTTMYSAVSSRSVEIATLRAIGFGASGVVCSVLAEALLLALGGAVFGSLIAWLLFNGTSLSISGGNSITSAQVVYRLSISEANLTSGILLACLVGCVGGLLPAIRAARMQVAPALRRV
jgi:putative ABC transport system permease protein